MKTHVEALKALEGEVNALRKRFHDSLQHTMQGVYGVFGQVLDKAKHFCPPVYIPLEGLDP